LFTPRQLLPLMIDDDGVAVSPHVAAAFCAAAAVQPFQRALPSISMS